MLLSNKLFSAQSILAVLALTTTGGYAADVTFDETAIKLSCDDPSIVSAGVGVPVYLNDIAGIDTSLGDQTILLEPVSPAALAAAGAAAQSTARRHLHHLSGEDNEDEEENGNIQILNDDLREL